MRVPGLTWLYRSEVHWTLTVLAFLTATWLAWTVGERLGRRRHRVPQPVAHRLDPQPNQELERQNRWLAEINKQLSRERDVLDRRCKVAHREGELEALDWCVREATFHDSLESLVRALLRRRRGTDGSV